MLSLRCSRPLRLHLFALSLASWCCLWRRGRPDLPARRLTPLPDQNDTSYQTRLRRSAAPLLRSQHSPSSIKVTLGDYILNSDIESIPHEVFSVVEVLLHPNFRFTPQADRYDVAVLELDRTASYKDNIKPICLPQKDANFVGRVAYVAGWGALQAGESRPDPQCNPHGHQSSWPLAGSLRRSNLEALGQ